MKLLSANVGRTRTVTHAGRSVDTAIWKSAVEGAVHVGPLGLDGDTQANTKFHGGVQQAVYVYDHSHYQFWSNKLERDDFTFGQFGENFTVEKLPDDHVYIGDTFQIGSVVAQVSQPRTPCFKLDLRMGITGFLKQFTQSCRIGYYFRILESGSVAAGDTILLVEQAAQRMTVEETFRIMHIDKDNVEGAKQAADMPDLSPEWRAKFQAKATGKN